MKNVFIYPSLRTKKTAKRLADLLGVKRIRLVNSKFKGSKKKVVINWGSSNLPSEVRKCKIINDEPLVRLTFDKRRTFEFFKNNNINYVPFTFDKEVAESWLDDGNLVVARTLVQSSQGKGIVLVGEGYEEELPDAPLYTLYVPKKKEFRVHISSESGVFYIQRKVVRYGEEPKDWRIRNHENGFIFQTESFSDNEFLLNFSDKIFDSLLNTFDFPFVVAADIIWQKKTDTYFCLELNSAPAISYKELLYSYEGQLVEMINKLLNSQ